MSRNFELLKRAELERQSRPSVAEVDGLDVSRPVRPLPSDLRRVAPQPPRDAVRPGFTEEVAPEISKLVQNLFVTQAIAPPRVVLFTPVARTTAPHFVAAQVAETLADQHVGRIALLDADVQSPSLHAYFGVTNSPGLADALHGAEPVQTYAHGVAGLDLMLVTAGTPTRNWQHLMAGDLMTERLRELRSAFDYVVITAPPITDCPGIASLGQRTDGAVLIIEANDTRRDVAIRMKQQWERSNTRLLGAVLNNRTYPIPESLYARL